MDTKEKYYQYDRTAWQALFHDRHKVVNIDDLDEIVSLNDRLTNEDVREIYRPLLEYIDMFYVNKREFRQRKVEFLQLDKQPPRIPFIIGISGSVAVGKSTVARVLQELLSKVYPQQRVNLVTTDGFLYSNKTLTHKGILHRKGFPESYDMPRFLQFMTAVKLGTQNITYPIYSHDTYDVTDQLGVLNQPDILIVEGINIFQLPENQQLYVSDFFDFSIYVDADPMDIKQWYTERYRMHLHLAKDQPDSYYYPMTQWSDEKIEAYANEIWYTINLTNLIQHIAPTKERAHVILHKSDAHFIDTISIRKY